MIILSMEKTYVFQMVFGKKTDTLDAYGKVTDGETSTRINAIAEKMTTILPEFQGNIEQIPPSFSAKKIDGRRAYALAREGSAR